MTASLQRDARGWRNAPIAIVALSAVLVAAAYASAFGSGRSAQIGAWLMALGSASLTASTLALGALRHGRTSRAAAVAAWITFGIVFAGYALALLVPVGGGPAPRTLLGLPLVSALLVYGVGLLPLPILVIAYVRDFDDARLDADRVRQRAAAIAAARANPARHS